MTSSDVTAVEEVSESVLSLLHLRFFFLPMLFTKVIEKDNK